MFLWADSEGWSIINLNSGVMLEAADLQSEAYADKIIDWENWGMVVYLFSFSYFYFVAVAWLFSRYSFMSTTADAELIMVFFDRVETLDSAIIFWAGDEIVYVCSFLAHSRTWGSDE